MRTSAVSLLVAAGLVAAADLAYKAIAVERDGARMLYHERSAGYAIVLAVALAWAVALLAARSPLLAAAGGVVAGGALGNVLSPALWPGVPNPLVVETASTGIAFNLADVAALAGGAVLVPLAVGLHAVRHRHELRRSVSLRA
jgi:hypothetical protein